MWSAAGILGIHRNTLARQMREAASERRPGATIPAVSRSTGPPIAVGASPGSGDDGSRPRHSLFVARSTPGRGRFSWRFR